MRLKLAVFDVDGTLSDSQAHIHGAMSLAFATAGLPAPSLAQVLEIVGLSLPLAVARLAPDLPPEERSQIVECYKHSYFTQRAAQPAPLYPGAAEMLARLGARPDWLMGVATGKSRRGLTHLLGHYGLAGHFVTTQVADDHPSKPHPAMLLAALAETGVVATDAVMIGDTTYDMEMGRNAGLRTIAVSWGYHPVAALLAAGADRLVTDFTALEAALDDLMGGA